MGYLWLPITLAKLRGLEPYEVLQALLSKQRYPMAGRSPDGVRILVIWARTRSGRPLVVALRRVPDSARDWWIVGARDMSDDERVAFQEWEAKVGEDHE